jgi:hypothetical protein
VLQGENLTRPRLQNFLRMPTVQDVMHNFFDPVGASIAILAIFAHH